MQAPNDVMLILDRDAGSLSVLRSVADRLGCDRIEVDALEGLSEILAVRRPTIAVLAIDKIETDGLAVLQALADHGATPATLFVGSVNARVLASAKRAAQSRGLTVIGVSERPLDALRLERVLTAHLAAPPPILRAEIEKALLEHEFMLLYQPKVGLDPEGLRLRGVEALVRWQHPQRGPLRPRHFLGAVEEFGLITNLTDFVMTEAVRQVGHWRVRGIVLEMVVNLSPRLVRDRAFPERLGALLRENEVPPQQIMLDVTEPSSVDEQELMLDVFTRLRILGCGLSLDNFGTGMSTLTQLYRMPFSEIKVDGTLMLDVTREPEARVIVRAMVNLAHALGLAVCAEGVETREMLEFAREAGFDSAQGRLFSSALPPAVIEQIVDRWPGAARSGTGIWRALAAPGVDDAPTRPVQRPTFAPGGSR